MEVLIQLHYPETDAYFLYVVFLPSQFSLLYSVATLLYPFACQQTLTCSWKRFILTNSDGTTGSLVEVIMDVLDMGGKSLPVNQWRCL